MDGESLDDIYIYIYMLIIISFPYNHHSVSGVTLISYYHHHGSSTTSCIMRRSDAAQVCPADLGDDELAGQVAVC